jgi:glycosyltransferase involved in cell wall biosynthesis
MPAFNAGKYIEESINSVRAQTFKEWELIVIDDGSTDNTSNIIKDYEKIDERIKYLYQTNSNQSVARNYGISRAKGDWIAFLDSDDIWLPNKLELQFLAADNYKGELIYSQGYYFNNFNNNIENYDSIIGYFSGIDTYKKLYFHNYIPILSVMVKLSAFKSVNFSPNIDACEDWNLWLHFARLGINFYGMEDRLFYYRIHTLQFSNNKDRMFKSIFNNLIYHYDKKIILKNERFKFESNIFYSFNIIFERSIEENSSKLIHICLIKLFYLNYSFKYLFSIIILFLFKFKSKKIIMFLLYRV